MNREIQKTSLPLGKLFVTMERAPFAESLHELTRFKERFYLPEFGDTNEIWGLWVEPFSSLIAHQRDFTGWSILFHSLSKNFSLEEQILGILADAIHDLGEVEISGEEFVGDVIAGSKTNNDIEKEKRVAHVAIDLLASQGLEDLAPLMHLAYDQVVVGENKKLHRAHKARERWDYVRAGLHLYDLAVSEKLSDQPEIYALDWFIARILIFDMPKITQELALEFPSSIGQQLQVHEESIEGAFLRSRLFLDQILAGERSTLIEDDFADLRVRLNKSYGSWQNWQEVIK